ncbi:MAG: hypothetical protein ACK5GV_04560 [Bacteroidota bacterium]
MADAVDAWRREIIQSKLPATRIPDQSPRHVGAVLFVQLDAGTPGGIQQRNN